jgi:hypothetical protein
MLHVNMRNKIVDNLNVTFIITVDGSRSLNGKAKFSQNLVNLSHLGVGLNGSTIFFLYS